MATCPKCSGFLGEGHRCRGAWRRHAWSLFTALCGALLGVVAAATLSDHATNLLMTVAGVLGAVLFEALRRAATW